MTGLRQFFYQWGAGLLVLLGLAAGSTAWANPIQGLHQDVLSQMETEEPAMLPRIQILWRHALMRNPTLQLALQKLAEKTGKLDTKEKGKFTEKILQGVIQFGGIGGAVASGNPAPLVGSAMLARATQTPAVSKRLTEVTSADLVVLAREVERAQSQLAQDFQRYLHAQQLVSHLQDSMTHLAQQRRQLPSAREPLSETLGVLLMQEERHLKIAQEQLALSRHSLVAVAGEDGVTEADNYKADSSTKADQALQSEQVTQQEAPSHAQDAVH